MPYIVVVLPHDLLGKFELMAQRKTEAEVRAIAETASPFSLSEDNPPVPANAPTNYSAIIWEGTLDDAYDGTLGKPLAIYYRGKEWTADTP